MATNPIKGGKPGFRVPPSSHGSLGVPATSVFEKKTVDTAQIISAGEIAQTSPLVTPTELTGESQYTIGKSYPVPIGIINSNPYNPRQFYPIESVDELSDSIRKYGQQQPGTGFVAENGRIIIIDGETRLRAIRNIGFETMNILIVAKPENPLNQYMTAREINRQRIEQTALDDAVAWRRLLDNGVFKTQVELSLAMNISQDELSRVLSLNNLPHAIALRISEEKDLRNNFRMMLAILDFYKACNDTEKTQELIFEIQRNKLGYREVKLKAELLSKAPVKRPRQEKSKLDYRGSTLVLSGSADKGNISLQNIPQELFNEIKELIARTIKDSESKQ